MLRKTFLLLFVLLLFISISTLTTNAADISNLEKSTDDLITSLPSVAQDDLDSIGALTTDALELSDVSFESIINLFVSKLKGNSTAPLSACAIVIAILILNALFDSYSDLLHKTSIKEVLSIISTLCITTTLIFPVIELIESSVATITDASNFMLIYIPIMVAILTFSGNAVTGASYYSFMVLACQGVSQFSTKFISPLLNVYLGFCVSSSINTRVNLKSLCLMFSKIIKWLIAFVMTVFSALLTIRGMITTTYDSVTARAVRFTMSSFIPIVGAALSESYKTIQGSINLLRTGAGVFVILAICVVFLPSIAKCFMWLFAVNLCKSVGEIIGVVTSSEILSAVSSVISTIFAITVCIMSVFIISTALLITLGGVAQ